MKRSCLIVAMALALTAAEAVSAADSIGQIISIQGSAIAIGPDSRERPLALKEAIFLNDRIVTRAGAKLQILFNDDSVMSQGESSEMTIDEYVYTPKQKESNRCSVRIVKGLFRVLTGKITAINADRFQVKTRMATIGIRGCDLGFKVTELSENVYIIQLHGQESVTVVTRPGAGGGEWNGLANARWDDPDTARTHLINVLKSNRIIAITQADGASQRELTLDELSILILGVTPQIPGSTGDLVPGGGTGDGPGMGTDNWPGVDTGDDLGMGLGEVPGVDTGTGSDSGADTGDTATIVQGSSQAAVDAALAAGDRDILLALLNDPLTTDVQRLAIEAKLAELAAADHQALVDAAILSVDEAALIALLADPSTTDAQRGAITTRLTDVHQARVDAAVASSDTTLLQALLNDPLTTPSQQLAIQSRLSQLTAVTFIRKGGGAYWDWGIWDKQGLLDRVDVTSASVLSATDFQAIATGAARYYLSGSGDAAAVISHGGENRLVAGFADPAARANNGVTALGCTINVQLGANAVPSWDGAFSMNNSAGDTLQFNVDSGTIRTTGELMGTPSFYSMNVRGTAFNTITTENVSGSLVGPGGGTPPAGVIGKFQFTHGASATVDGIFGSNLTSVPQ